LEHILRKKTAYKMFQISVYTILIYWPGSSVGIATGYGLDGPGIEKKIPVEARFFAAVHTGHEAHPASCTMGIGSFPGLESGRGVTLSPHPLLVPRSKNRVVLMIFGCNIDKERKYNFHKERYSCQ
jgi:hypothetical protein